MSGGTWLRWLERTSLHRQYSLVVGVIVGVLLVTALLCSATVVWASSHIQDAEERATALQIANRDVLQQMSDAHGALRDVILDNPRGDIKAPPSYDNAIVYLSEAQTRLERLASGEAVLREAVRLQKDASRAWVVEYAQPRLMPGSGPQIDDDRGDSLFRTVRSANARVSERIDEVTAGIRRESQRVLGAALAVVVLFPLAALGLATLIVNRAGRAVVLPLTHLAGVLERLRAGDVEVRAEVSGPEEIRQIARALNSLTDENVRASEVEADVIHQLESIDRVRTDLVSTVSHELRTPLTSISGYLELLEDDLADRLDDQQQAMMRAVRRNLDRLNELITNLLALSRAEETTLAVEPIDLRAVAAEVTADVRLQAAARDITVRTVPSPAGVEVLGDRSQLIRAVQNLVTNAVKFSRPGGFVEVRVGREGDEAVLEVVDEGIGIPEADLGGLGSRFYRASNAMKAEIAGTGLGLRIVQTILDRHDGSLGVESVEGEGTTFTLRLPAAPRPAERRPADGPLEAALD